MRTAKSRKATAKSGAKSTAKTGKATPKAAVKSAPKTVAKVVTAPTPQVDVSALVEARVAAAVGELRRQLDGLCERLAQAEQAPTRAQPSIDDRVARLFARQHRVPLSWQIQVRATQAERELLQRVIDSQRYGAAPRHEVMRRLMWAGACALGIIGESDPLGATAGETAAEAAA